ncbi:hypothetical protein Lepil_2203 [Leptonema illini DSM 21528]|uniref:Uncharacterized protein n=1 Tax=Leptonema illini DSM 21528 TaxID=929563 RepID=H2CGG5_9LEPT|nr:hypothetical protein Lepil_2203 [Leptonema illini DSM 21528]
MNTLWDGLFSGKPDAGNLHVRFDEGEGCRASGTLSTLLVEFLYSG